MRNIIFSVILNRINAFGLLENTQKNVSEDVLCFGPRDVHGKTWSGVVIWQRPAGYYNYETLDIMGIWVKGELDGTRIIVGTRTLDYIAPYYNPESYFKHIRKDFAVYYGKHAPPPDEKQQLYTALYESDQRLHIRKAIEQVLDSHVT